MSSKIAKRMMSRVDDMVSRASSATKQAHNSASSKRKATKRALLQGTAKRKGSNNSVVKKSSSITKQNARSKKGRKPMGLLDLARRELRGKSRVERNISLLSYRAGRGGQSRGTGGDNGSVAKAGESGAVNKSRRVIEHLLQLDNNKGGGRIKRG